MSEGKNKYTPFGKCERFVLAFQNGIKVALYTILSKALYKLQTKNT